MQVEHHGIGILGWDKVEPPAEGREPPGAPVGRVRSVSIMGGTDIKRGPGALALAVEAPRAG